MLAQNASQVSSTPENFHNEESRKRKRDILSCLACRQRKLKCDRGYPSCSRCVKGSNASSCTYQTVPGNDDRHQEELEASCEESSRAQKRARSFYDSHQANGPASAKEEIDLESYTNTRGGSLDQSNVIKSLEHRLATLESMLSKNSSSFSSGRFQLQRSLSAVTTASRPDASVSTEPNTQIFKGSGLRTQFYGPSNPTSLFAHVGLS